MKQMQQFSRVMAMMLVVLHTLGSTVASHLEGSSYHNQYTQAITEGFEAITERFIITRERRAAIGDFAKFNELFDNAKILIPGSFNINERIFIGTLDLTLTNIKCFDISIGDILLSHTQPSNQAINMDVQIQQLDMTCELDYTYKYGILPRGDGKARIFTDNNSLDTLLGFTSTDFNSQPPTASSALSCNAGIEITNIDFEGDLVSNIVEWFERFIRDTIEREIEGVACEELASLGTSFVGDILDVAEETLAEYEGDLGPSATDPLYMENTFEIPSTLNPVNLQDTNSTLGQWFNQALEQADNLLGAVVPDPDGPSPDKRDLGANKLIRDSLLDENRALVVDIDQLPMDAVLFKGHDQLTETTIAINQVKVIGLDTLTLFNPLDRIGKYTLQTEIVWDNLSVEFDVTVSIKPSSLEESILEDATSDGIVERILIDFGVNDIAVDASLFLLVDEDVLGSMQVGPLLYTDNIIPCLLSVLHTIQLSGLDVNPQLVNAPTLTGFISPGIDRIISNSALAVFDMYTGVLKNALPNIFQTSVRNFVNREVIDSFLLSDEMSTFPPTVAGSSNSILDFRDLLLPPTEARSLGATGNEPYGDLAYTAFDLLKDNLLSTDSNGLLDLNSFLIDPVTESQSGTVGSILIPSELLSLKMTDFANDYIRSFVDSFEIGLSNLRVNNLNTLKPPVSILEATGSPHILKNILTMGPVDDQPLELVVRLLLNLTKEGESPLEMANEVDLSLSFDSASIGSDLIAKINSGRFLEFPLQDILDIDCWLATIDPPLMSEDGFRLSESDITLALPAASIGLSGLGLGVDFVKTDSAGIGAIPEVLDLYEMSSASALLLERMNAFGEEFLESNMLQLMMDRALVSAPKACPHNPQYDEAAATESNQFSEIPFPDLSVKTIDSLFYGAALVAEMAFLTFIEEKRLEPIEETDALDAQNADDIFQDLFDWTNLEEQGGTVVQAAIDALTGYLGGPREDSNGDLGINTIIGDWVLNGTQELSSVFDDISFDLPGVTISLHSLNVTGLDSFSELDLWEPIAPQTIQNRLQLEGLQLKVALDVSEDNESTSRQRLTIGLSISEIQAEIALFLAMSRDGLENVNIGSFLVTENILPCFMSAVDKAEIAKIQLTVGNFDDPTFEGLLPDSQLSIDAFTEEVMAVFRTRILESIPMIFDTTVKDLLNGLLSSYMENEPCPTFTTPVTESRFIEFDDFFDAESSTYGDLPSLLRELVDTQLIELDLQTQQPRINENVIGPLTREQSGIEGTLLFEGEVITFSSEPIPQFGIDTLGFRATDTSVANLNTIVQPLKILNPSPSNEHVLDNVLTLSGDALRTMKFATDAVFELSGVPALSFDNKIKLSVDLGGAEALLSILAKLEPSTLLNFPLSDVLNADCLFSMFASSLKDANGIWLEETTPSLAIQTILLSIPAMNFSAECVDCSSPGLSILPEVLSVLDENGSLELLEQRIVALGLDVAESDFTQARLNRMILDGDLSCPHTAHFRGENSTSNYPIPSFPSLSYDSMETLAFAASTALGMGTIILAESHSPDRQQDFGDSPIGEQFSGSLADFNLMDFSSLETSIGEWADSAVNTVLDYLTQELDDPSGPNGKDIRVNNLLRSAFLNNEGDLEFELKGIGIEGLDSEMSIQSVRISGLDSIRSMGLLEATAPQELQNSLKWESLGLEVSVGLSGNDSIGQGRSLQEQGEIKFSLTLADVDLSMGLLLAIDMDLLGSLQLGSMVDIQNIFSCLVSTARLAQMKDFKVSVGAIKELSIDGFASQEIATAAAGMYEKILSTYGDSIIDALPNFFDHTIKAFFNSWLAYYLNDESNTACPVSSFESMVDFAFVDLRDLLLPASVSRALGGSGLAPYGDLFERLLSLAQDLVFAIDTETGLSKVNTAVIGPLTRSQSKESGTLIFPGDLFSGGSRLKVGGLDATVQLLVGDAWIANLDTIGDPLELLAPTGEPHALNNTITFAAGDRSLNAGLRLLFSLVGDDDVQLQNDVNIQLDLSRASLVLGALLKVAAAGFRDFPLRDVLDLNCWLATIPSPTLDNRGVRMQGQDTTAALMDLAASISSLNLNITCNECSSPRMQELTNILQTAQAQEEATGLMNKLLDLLKELLSGDFMQVQIDRALSKAAYQCPHHPDYDATFTEFKFDPFVSSADDASISFLVLLGAVTFGLILVVAILMLTIKFIVFRRHRRFLSKIPEEQVQQILRKQEEENREEEKLNQGTLAMVSSPDIPTWIRLGMPVIILGNIAFFLSGHLSLGATVNIVFEFAGEKVVVEKFFEFSMARSTVDIWNAGGRELAILILIFSGIWPYTKQIITLVLWFTPPTRVSTSRRGSILLWLDWLAKWSMIDIFVLVISIVAFRVSIQSPEVGILPDSFYSLDLLVVPLWGLYANMIAQLISQISSHFIIHYHRKIVSGFKHRESISEKASIMPDGTVCDGGEQRSYSTESTSFVEGSGLGTVCRLSDHKFCRTHRGEREKLVVRDFVNTALYVAAFLLLVLMVVGSVLPSFSLNVFGLVALAVESGQRFEDATKDLNIFSVVKILMDEARFLGGAGDWVGLGTLSFLFIFTILIVPLLQCLVLLWQWFSASSDRRKVKVSILIEILQAWQYAEVYLIAIFVASWQLGPISNFMVNVYCRSLDDTFSEWVFFGIIKEEDAQCFSVESTISVGFYILALGAVLLALINTFVIKATIQYFRDRAFESSTLLLDEEKQEVVATPDINDVRPIPVLFSDTFRWLMRNDGTMPSGRTSNDQECPLKSDFDTDKNGSYNLQSKGSNQVESAIVMADHDSSATPTSDATSTGFENEEPELS